VVQSVRWNCVSHREPGQNRPCVADETIEYVRQTFVLSPWKSTKRASLKLIVPKTTVWNILKKRFRCKPYRLQLVQALSDGDKEKRHEFCGEMFEKKIKNEDDYLNKIVYRWGYFSSEWQGHKNMGYRESTWDRRTCAGLAKTKRFLCCK